MQQRAQSDLDFLEYATSMLQQLRDMSRANKRDMLAYMIDMASIEAAEELAEARASLLTRQK